MLVLRSRNFKIIRKKISYGVKPEKNISTDGRDKFIIMKKKINLNNVQFQSHLLGNVLSCIS